MSRAPRSVSATLLGGAAVLASALALPISLVSGAMVAVGSYGTSPFDPVGWLVVVAGPPATLVAGIGFLRRRAWAHRYFVACLALVILRVGHALLTEPFGPSTSTTVSPTGVLTTVSRAGTATLLPALAIAGALLGWLSTPRRRAEFAVERAPSRSAATDASGDWRVGHVGRDRMYYEERRDGRWERLEISGEMLTGRAHHVIYFASPERWAAYPEWARHRRDEIVARIKSAFREPDYEYDGA